RGESLGADGEALVQAHVALDGGQRERGRLPGREGLRGAAGDELAPGGVVADQRGEGGPALLIGAQEDGAVGGVEQGDDAVGGAEVDADRFAEAGGGEGRHGGRRRPRSTEPATRLDRESTYRVSQGADS